MVDPTQPDAAGQGGRGDRAAGMRAICLFPAMHRYAIQDERATRLFDVAAAAPGTAVFVHCGVLSVGVRKKLGLPSPFDIRFGNPLDLHAIALALSAGADHHPALRRRHAARGADGRRPLPQRAARHVELERLDASTSASSLPAVFRQALAVVGPERLLFGTDSSFFPRGWVSDVYEQQSSALDEIGASADAREKIFGGNFDRLFPAPSPSP